MSNAAPLSCRHAVPDDVPDIVFSIGRAEWQSVNKALRPSMPAPGFAITKRGRAPNCAQLHLTIGRQEAPNRSSPSRKAAAARKGASVLVDRCVWGGWTKVY